MLLPLFFKSLFKSDGPQNKNKWSSSFYGAIVVKISLPSWCPYFEAML